MMDDIYYSAKALEKILKYQKNGCWSGENLIITFEHPDCAFDIEAAEKATDRYYL